MMPFDQLTTFDFEEHAVRVVMIDGNPWFVAADVCRVLEISKHRDAISKLDDDERGSVKLDTLGGKQEVAAVNESGFYAIVLRCRDAMAAGTVPHRFRKWVTSEVLPSLRRSGRYEMPGYTPTPDPVQFIEEANQRGLEYWLSTVREARLVSGVGAAKRIWAQSPLPPLDDGQGAGTIDLSGSLERFIHEQCEVTGNPHDTVAARDLVAAYRAWCAAAGHGPVNEATVARRLAVLAGQWRDPDTGRGFAKGKASVSIYRGIRLR